MRRSRPNGHDGAVFYRLPQGGFLCCRSTIKQFLARRVRKTRAGGKLQHAAQLTVGKSSLEISDRPAKEIKPMGWSGLIIIEGSELPRPSRIESKCYIGRKDVESLLN